MVTVAVNQRHPRRTDFLLVACSLQAETLQSRTYQLQLTAQDRTGPNRLDGNTPPTVRRVFRSRFCLLHQDKDQAQYEQALTNDGCSTPTGGKV